MKNINFFVYGSLREGFYNYNKFLAGKIFKKKQGKLHNVKLYHMPYKGYPAIVPGEDYILGEIMEAYINLHKKGFATSVEVYKDQELVGGLYGVKIGKCFFGESMFSKKSNASKVALISICKKLEEEGYIFLDCQMHTNHLESMGGKFVSWKEFKVMLKEGLAL